MIATESNQVITDAKEKNEHYRQVNDRFEHRAAILRSFGFEYIILADYEAALFVKKRIGFKKPHTIQTSFVSFADETAWADKLNDVQM